MNFSKQDINEFKKIIESIIDVKIANKRITNYISAIVTGVDEQGYVSVVIPPETDKIVTGLLNKTCERLYSGDSVEIATKNGALSNAWVAIKHGTNNNGITITGKNGDNIQQQINDLQRQINELKSQIGGE